MKYALILILLSLFGCGSSLGKDAVAEFKLQNPKFTLIDSRIGEGDADNAYVYIKYKKPADINVYEDIVLYQNIENKISYIIVESKKINDSGT